MAAGQLIEYCNIIPLATFSCHPDASNPYLSLLQEVAERTGHLVALWQSVGFVHGVLNTDNTSILGLTIDYGPFGFLDRFDPQFTPNLTDYESRRYTFLNQPEVCQWNVVQLGNTFLLAGLVKKEEAEEVLPQYSKVSCVALFNSERRKGLLIFFKLIFILNR